MSRFFIQRPIFAWVIAIVMMMAGLLSISKLPVSQYPDIAPPSVTVQAIYNGASAQTAQDSVTQVIEQQMTGLDGLLYMSSTSDSSGAVQIELTFQTGTDPDMAQVQVQNRLQSATPLLPEVVQRTGVQVRKGRTGFLMVIGFISEDGRMSAADLGDYMVSNVQDTLARVQGVGNLQVFASKYAMRIWLNPEQMNSFRITTADVIGAIQAQNAQVAVGQLGGAPSVEGQQINATVTAQTRLQTPEQFREIRLRVNPDGSTVHLSDVARVELGTENYAVVSNYNGKPAAGMAVQLATGANALDTAERVRAKLAEMQPNFPAGVKTVIPFDTTPFVKISIEEVVKTLIEAVVLVFLVMYLFLQNFRATIIPTLAVPVVLLGTLAVMLALGYSINTLTMFAMVLAIGLLVDDAIVVVENVERIMDEEKLPPKEAALKSMGQISGALVGIGLVLSAVFVPMAFFPGATGVIYRQFSVTIVTAMVLSVIVALIFTPALAATLLKQHGPGEKKIGGPLGGFFNGFNRLFSRGQDSYQRGVGGILRRPLRMVVIYGLLIAGLVFMFQRMPTSFVPDEDQGVMFTQVMLPAGATQERTLGVLKKVEGYFLGKEKDLVESVFSVAGFSFSGQGQNMGLAFVRLKPWDERTDASLSVKALAQRAMGLLFAIKEAMVFSFVPPAILELGTANGFTMNLQDTSNMGHDRLIQSRNMLLGMAGQEKSLVGVRPNGMEDAEQFSVNIDHQKAGALGLSVADVNSTLSTAWGSSYVNDFVDRGRVKRVYVQGDAPFRMMPEDLNNWYVRNNQQQMVPLNSLATTAWNFGPMRLERFNGLPSVQIQGSAAPGLSSGQAMDTIEGLAGKLPPGTSVAWSGTSYQERSAGSNSAPLYALSILVVFLCLAALYESWSIPLAVLFVVPLGVFGALLASTLRGFSNDVYFQVALLTAIGLAAKNAILIVEFAKEQHEAGKSLYDATLEAVHLRLRPILMTSLAFGFGVLPLAISRGAGSGAQNAVGTGVLGGMLAATFLGLLFVPLFYLLVMSAVERFSRKRHDRHPDALPPHDDRHQPSGVAQ